MISIIIRSFHALEVINVNLYEVRLMRGGDKNVLASSPMSDLGASFKSCTRGNFIQQNSS
jgi:hypothetical protein